MWLSNKNLKANDTSRNRIVLQQPTDTEDPEGNIVYRIDNNNKHHYYKPTKIEKMELQIKLLKLVIALSVTTTLISVALLLIS